MMMMMKKKKEDHRERVCVTGAGGYLASWVVKLLLSKSYMVHGTVRDPSDEAKNGHLKKLDNATENLQLYKADLMDYEGLCSAIVGCTGVIHVACPVPYAPVSDPEVEVLEPAITGTKNVLNACLAAKVNKVVVVSSVSAVWMNPNWPKDQAMDENCWSDIDHCKAKETWYSVGKTISEREAFEFGRTNGLNVLTVCPSMVFGPMLQSTINASSLFLLDFFKDETGNVEDKQRPVVDVRDAAEAILLAYEKPEAEGRYICSSYDSFVHQAQFLVETLKKKYSKFNDPGKLTEADPKIKLCSNKLLNLGWKCRPLEETIVDALHDLEDKGLLEK